MSKNTVSFNPDVLTYTELVELIKDLENGNMDDALVRVVPVIASWSYVANLSDPNVWNKLPFGEPFSIVRSLLLLIERLANEEKSRCEVDFASADWTYGQNKKFVAYRASGQHDEAQKMLATVVKHPDFVDTEPLNAVIGSAMYLAFQEAYKKVVEGKN